MELFNVLDAAVQAFVLVAGFLAATTAVGKARCSWEVAGHCCGWLDGMVQHPQNCACQLAVLLPGAPGCHYAVDCCY